MSDFIHPILTCAQAQRFEQALLTDEAAQWSAMSRAGAAVGAAILADWQELGGSVAVTPAAQVAALPAGAVLPAGIADSPMVPAPGGASGRPRILVLVGKGHNGGDALLAAQWLARRLWQCEIVLLRSRPLDQLRPLCRRAWDVLLALPQEAAATADATLNEGNHPLTVRDLTDQADFAAGTVATALRDSGDYLFCIDGLLGMQFHPPLGEPERLLLAAVNALPESQIGLRAAVDLPSGLGEPEGFCAHFTYATGIAKTPAFELSHCAQVGRLRYLDIGFFAGAASSQALARARSLKPLCASDAAPDKAPSSGKADASDKAVASEKMPASENENSPSAATSLSAAGTPVAGVLTQGVLAPFRQWRSPLKDKRYYGHLFIMGGSAAMPGAVLMNVRAALHSGAGLVTAFVPESVAAVFAAQVPEAMWVPWPQTDEGTLALEGQHLLLSRLERADALLVGSGMGQSAETLALLEDIARTTDLPLVLDADALQPSVLAAAAHPRGAHGTARGRTAGTAMDVSDSVADSCTSQSAATAAMRPLVITPHAGEFARLSGLSSPSALMSSALVSPAPMADAATAGGKPRVSGDFSDIGATALLTDFCKKHSVVAVVKGARTQVVDAASVAYSLFGGPVLARGGSGDVLAGLVGGCLAQRPQEPLLAAQQGVCWHGCAATVLARQMGQVSLTTGDLVRCLPAVLRGGRGGSGDSF